MMSFAVEATSVYRRASDAITKLIAAILATKNSVLTSSKLILLYYLLYSHARRMTKSDNNRIWTRTLFFH